MAHKALRKLGDTDSLTDKAYKSIKSALNNGAFRPGERLTSREVADSLGVSITPAREALGKLVAEGSLEMHGPRTIVVPLLTLERYEEILQIRRLLEGFAARSAAERIDQQIIGELEGIENRFEKAREEHRLQEALNLNTHFHFTLYQAGGNEKLAAMIEALWVMIGPSLSLLYPKYVHDDTGIIPHRKIIAGLKNNDADAVHDAVVEDLDTGAEKMRDLLIELAA